MRCERGRHAGSSLLMRQSTPRELFRKPEPMLRSSFPPHWKKFSPERTQFQLPDHEHRLAHDLLRHFRRAGMPVDEDNRNLPGPEPFLDTSIVHLDLKRITVGFYLVQLNRLKNSSAKALEPTRAI